MILKIGDSGNLVKKLQSKLQLLPDGIFGPLTQEAVRRFQAENLLTPDGIAGPRTLAALDLAPVSRRIDEIIVHYTATPRDEDFSVAQVKASHLARGFSDIGYHWLVYRDGSVHPGRPESLAGAHCLGHNSHSIGVCYVGGCPPRSVKNWMNIGLDTRTPAQKAALSSLIKDLKLRYPNATVHGHNEFAAKPCPGFNAAAEYSKL